MTYSQDQVRSALRQLPEPVREFLLSEETALKIQRLGEQYKLHVDQLGTLSDSILYLLLGLQSLDEFKKALTGTFNVAAEAVGPFEEKLKITILEPYQKLRAQAVQKAISERDETKDSQDTPTTDVEQNNSTGTKKGLDPYLEPVE